MIPYESLDPKADFLRDAKRAGAHQEVMASPVLKEAIKIALLEYAVKLGGPNVEAHQLATFGLRLEGAKGFIETLLNLGNKSKPLHLPQDHQLDNV